MNRNVLKYQIVLSSAFMKKKKRIYIVIIYLSLALKYSRLKIDVVIFNTTIIQEHRKKYKILKVLENNVTKYAIMNILMNSLMKLK